MALCGEPVPCLDLFQLPEQRDAINQKCPAALVSAEVVHALVSSPPPNPEQCFEQRTVEHGARTLLASMKADTLVSLRDRAIVALLIFTAARAGAVAALRRGSLYDSGGQWMLHFDEKGGKSRVPALTRAGIAHLYFISIHPFEDGNGRIARAICEKALAQSLGQPTLIALAATILTKRKSYYDALEAANKSNQISAWLAWFAAIAIEAQSRTISHIQFLIAKTRLLDRLRGHLNSRQEKALLRILQEGPEGFKGGLSANNYVRITGASAATATRDLADRVAKGALVRTGERRYARYTVAIAPVIAK